jgi:hypothetical protein
MNRSMKKEQLTPEQLDRLPAKFRYFNKQDSEEEKVDVIREEQETTDARHLRFTQSDVYGTKKLLCEPLFRPTSKIQFRDDFSPK